MQQAHGLNVEQAQVSQYQSRLAQDQSDHLLLNYLQFQVSATINYTYLYQKAFVFPEYFQLADLPSYEHILIQPAQQATHQKLVSQAASQEAKL